MHDDSNDFFGNLLTGMFIVGGLATLFSCAQSITEKNRMQTEAMRRQMRRQDELDVSPNQPPAFPNPYDRD